MLKWNAREYKRQLLADLVSNGEIVGKFVEEDARKRILRVQDPDWGKGHRKYVSMLLTNEVEQKRNEVVIRVGLPPGKKTKSGETSRHLGYYIEVGSKTAPAHPYLRPAVFENGDKIVKLLEGK